MPVRRLLLACLAAVLVALPAIGADPARAAEPGIEAGFVDGINAVRAAAGLGPLQVHDELTAVARAWADTMASENRIWHNANVGTQVTAPWVVIGENVGTGYDVPTLMDAFVASPSHYRNLVDPRYDWVGVGVTWGTDGRLYTTHVFMDLGDPTPAPPAAIEAAPVTEATPPAPTPAAPAATVPAPAPAPPAAAAPPPPAATAPERVARVLAAVRVLDGGVA